MLSHLHKLEESADPELKRILEHSVFDSKYFSQAFMPETFDHPMTHQHDRFWELLDDETKPNTVICGWRGIGKTVSVGAKVMHAGCFRHRRFVLYVGQTFDHAVKQTEAIKAELTTNPMIREVFGLMRTKKYAGLDISSSKRDWYLCDPDTGEPFMLIMPRGSNQQVRGLNVRLGRRIVRPDLIIVDDPEHDKEIDSEENRRRFRTWLHASLMNCVDTKRVFARQGSDPYSQQMQRLYGGNYAMSRIIYVDTLKHEDARIAHLLEDPTWTGCRMSMCDIMEREKWDSTVYRGDLSEVMRQRASKFFSKHPTEKRFYYSNVPELISDEAVHVQVVTAREQQVLGEFYREKMCMPTAVEGATFSRDLFQYYLDATSNIQTNPDIVRAIIVDPARSVNVEHAYTAMLALSIDPLQRKIHQRRIVNRRMKPDEIYEECFKLALETNSRYIAVEDTGLKEFIRQPFEDAARMRNLPIRFIWLNARGGQNIGDFGTGRDAAKRARAAQIAPYYHQKMVWHDESLKDSAFEQQMLSYPRPRFWDLLDCAGYIPAVMAELGIHFAPPEPDPLGRNIQPSFPDADDAWEQAQDILSRKWALM